MAKSFSIGVSSYDLGVLTVCAFRYALGRASYMPGLVADLIRRHWDEITERDRLLIEVELARALREHEEIGRNIGWDCDVATWEKLSADLDRLRGGTLVDA